MVLYTSVEIESTGCSAVGSARGLGPWGREFESLHPDHGRLVRAFSSVGQSGRLITGWSKVRVLEGPPNVKKSKTYLAW